jgi:tripartite-type tricarboxylate transporter receptor subunit TctC
MRRMLACCLLGLGIVPGLAQSPPCDRITIVSPYAAGGPTDVLLRLVMDPLAAALNTTIVIENRPGAGSNIGTAYVAKAKADGCTLLANGTMLATYPYSYRELRYDPLKDLVPIGGLAATPTLLVAGKALPATDIGSLVTLGKDAKGLTFSSGGLGLIQHLAVEVLKEQTGANFIHVVYPGTGSQTPDLITGRVDFGSRPFGSVNGSIQAGDLKAIAVLQDKRSPLAPDIPSMTDQGVTPLDARVQFVLFAPAGTPSDIVSGISDKLARIVGDAALRGRFYAAGFEPTPATAQQAEAMMRSTADYWGPVIQRLGIKLN